MFAREQEKQRGTADFRLFNRERRGFAATPPRMLVWKER